MLIRIMLMACTYIMQRGVVAINQIYVACFAERFVAAHRMERMALNRS